MVSETTYRKALTIVTDTNILNPGITYMEEFFDGWEQRAARVPDTMPLHTFAELYPSLSQLTYHLATQLEFDELGVTRVAIAQAYAHIDTRITVGIVDGYTVLSRYGFDPDTDGNTRVTQFLASVRQFMVDRLGDQAGTHIDLLHSATDEDRAATIGVLTLVVAEYVLDTAGMMNTSPRLVLASLRRAANK